MLSSGSLGDRVDELEDGEAVAENDEAGLGMLED